MSSLFTDYAPLIAAFVAVAGWQVANRQANRRELRKELRDDIAELRRSIDRICTATRDYKKFDQKSRDAALAAVVVQQEFVLLDLRLTRLKQRVRKPGTKVHVTTLSQAQEEFFDLSTGDLIDSGIDLSPDDIQIISFQQYAAAGQLEHALAELFASEFHSR